MSTTPTRLPRPLPRWLTGAGSVFAVVHLLAIGLLALAAPSGPWLMANGQPSPALGPTFATLFTANVSEPYYLQPLRMTHNYHFESDRPVVLGIYFEVTLKDADGMPLRTIRFPDEKANFWVRHRQSLLAQGLGNDQILDLGSDPVPGVDKKLPKVVYWVRVDKETLQLKSDDVLKIRADRAEIPEPRPPVEHPSPTAKALVEAYARFLCRKHNAASVELVRVHQMALRPEKLILNTQPGDFVITKSHFGEYRRER